MADIPAITSFCGQQGLQPRAAALGGLRRSQISPGEMPARWVALMMQPGQIGLAAAAAGPLVGFEPGADVAEGKP